MKIEKQVCSLELARKLKELGMEQESIWYWCPKPINKEEYRVMEGIGGWNNHWSAFTVAELGELLPRIIVNEDRTYSLECSKDIRNDNFEWSIRYACETNDGFRQQAEKTEADARAKMLIMLIEDKLININ